MKMFAIRLKNPLGNTICESCGKKTADFGVVKLTDLESEIFQTNEGMTKRQKAECLIWDKGQGELLCESCLKKRMKK